MARVVRVAGLRRVECAILERLLEILLLWSTQPGVAQPGDAACVRLGRASGGAERVGLLPGNLEVEARLPAALAERPQRLLACLALQALERGLPGAIAGLAGEGVELDARLVVGLGRLIGRRPCRAGRVERRLIVLGLVARGAIQVRRHHVPLERATPGVLARLVQ